MTRIEGIKTLLKIFVHLFVQCIHRKYNSRAIARLPPLSLPCWRTWRHVFRDWTAQKTWPHQESISIDEGWAIFLSDLSTISDTNPPIYTSNFLEFEDDLASPCISRLSTAWITAWVVKYTNDDDARFTIDRWTDAFQLHSTAFSLPIKCEAEKLTSFENERSGRTR